MCFEILKLTEIIDDQNISGTSAIKNLHPGGLKQSILTFTSFSGKSSHLHTVTSAETPENMSK